MVMLIIPLFIFLLNVSPSASPAESPNLAREAQASASESYQTLSPEKANDGNTATSSASSRINGGANRSPERGWL